MGKEVKRDFLLVAAGMLVGFAGAVSYSTFAQREEFSKAIQPRQYAYLEVAGGQCRFGASPDGMWWVSDMHHSNRYKTNGCLQGGIAMNLNPSWEVSARWVNLGNATIDSQAVSCPDDDCSKSDPAVDKRRADCDKGPAVDCLQRVSGSWNIRGALFATSIEAFRMGDVEVRPEIGLFLYRIKGSIRIMPVGCDESACPWHADIKQQTGYYASPEIGLMLRYKYVFAGTQYFFRTTQHTPFSTGIGGPAQTWIVGARIPI